QGRLRSDPHADPTFALRRRLAGELDPVVAALRSPTIVRAALFRVVDSSRNPRRHRDEGRVVTRFLTTVWPVPGHLHPNLAVATELRRRGHEVAFFSGARVRSVVEGEGLDFFPFDRVDGERVDEILRVLGAPANGWRNAASRRALW